MKVKGKGKAKGSREKTEQGARQREREEKEERGRERERKREQRTDNASGVVPFMFPSYGTLTAVLLFSHFLAKFGPEWKCKL